MLEGYVKDNYYARFHTHGINDAEKTKLQLNFDSMNREIYVKGTGSRCLLEVYVKDNYYAKFHSHSYH